jgi:hypothetical protein
MIVEVYERYHERILPANYRVIFTWKSEHPCADASDTASIIVDDLMQEESITV